MGARVTVREIESPWTPGEYREHAVDAPAYLTQRQRADGTLETTAIYCIDGVQLGEFWYDDEPHPSLPHVLGLYAAPGSSPVYHWMEHRIQYWMPYIEQLRDEQPREAKRARKN
jgi:hypothetical protein